MEKKKTGKSDKLDRPAKYSPHKRLTDKQSSTKTPSLSSRGFRSVTASSEPVVSKTSQVTQRPGTNNNGKVNSHKRAESYPITSIDMDGSSSSDDNDIETLTRITQAKYSTPNTQSKYSTAITQLDSDRKTEQPRTKHKLSRTASGKKPLTSSNKRYILFLGNLSETSTHEDIVTHFKKRGVSVKELRLLTHKDSKKSRGCAFAEFENEKCFQNALKFHRSKLNGKTINIEVTCGGGGASVKRKTKILNKNRRQRIAKARKSKV